MSWLPATIQERLVIVLAHFVWQGVAVAALLAALMALLKVKRPSVRYASSLLAFMIMSACPIVTWFIVPDVGVRGVSNALGQSNEQRSTVAEFSEPEGVSPRTIHERNVRGLTLSGSPSTSALNSLTSAGDAQTADSHMNAVAAAASANWFETLRPFEPWIIGVWLGGVAMLSLRLLLGAIGLWRWRRGVEVLPESLVPVVTRLCAALSMLEPRVRVCRRVGEAVAVGLFKPMILLPAAWLVELPPDMLEAVLAHELAHVRRLDLWVNLWQRLVETLLFYHPAVWWLSRRLRVERELCCDELAATVTHDRLRYAETLEHVARLTHARSAPVLSVAMSGREGVLLHRIRQLLGVTSPSRTGSAWLAGAMTLGIVLTIALGAFVSSRADADKPPSDRAGRGSPDPVLDPTAGLPDSEDETNQKNKTKGDLRSNSAAGSGDPRRAQGQENARNNPRDATRLLTKRLSVDSQTRTLELIYVLRQYRVFSRDEEWAQAIRELAKIGQPAMFELTEELDRTDRDANLRSLGIALRAMNDPRAVPALIRAIPKTLRPGGSDCGVHIRDPDLMAFMQAHESHPDKDGSVHVGRPVNTILNALERLTGHHWPEGDNDPLRHIFLGPPETRVERLKPFLERQAHWQEWWAEHGKDFLTAAELRTLEQPANPQVIGEDGFDKVDRAGVARFGQLFPTGVDVRLGPVHDVELVHQSYADAPTVLDFDRHQTWRFFEAALDRSESFPDWIHRTGADVFCGANLQGDDTRVWVIDNSRWDTLDREVTQPGPLKLGIEPRGGMRMLNPDQKTLLFTTREGGSGILRLDPYNRKTGSRGIRYRMWPTERRAKDAPPAAPKVEVSGVWEAAFKVSLQSPGADKKCAWSLPGKRSLALASDISLENLSQRFWRNDEEFETWKRDNKITFFAVPIKHEREGFLGLLAGGAQEELTLFGFGCLSREVRPQAFTDLTVAMATQILSESQETELRNTESFSLNPSEPQPQTRLFLLSDGTIGLLQISKADKKQDVLEFQYKLARIKQDREDNANAKGDLRSNPAAGSGDPRRAQQSDERETERPPVKGEIYDAITRQGGPPKKPESGKISPNTETSTQPTAEQKPVTYKCRVITSGTKAPIAGATVVFKRMLVGDPRYPNEYERLIEKTTHVTDADGWYEVTIPPEQLAERYLYIELDVTHSEHPSRNGHGYAMSMIRKNELVGDRPFFETTILHPGRAATGTVVTSDGRPAADVKVDGFCHFQHRSLGRGPRIETRTDAEGKYRVVVPASGGGAFWLVPDDACPVGVVVSKEGGDLGTLTLKRGLRLSGQVLDADGRTIAGMHVSMRRQDSESPDLDRVIRDYQFWSYYFREAVTDSEGRFVMPPVEPGKYEFEISPNAEPSKPIPAFSGTFLIQSISIDANAKPLELRAVPTIEIRAQNVDSQGQPTRSFEFEITGKLNGHTFSGLSSRPNDGRSVARAPRGLKDANVHFNDNEHGIVRIRRKPGAPLESIDCLKFPSIDEDRLLGTHRLRRRVDGDLWRSRQPRSPLGPIIPEADHPAARG